uniref:Prolyl oligopeptidase family protein n=1 Tax=Haliea sp. ETY-M TaxID=1055105 RepID=A0A455R303_9GAMM|nr:prolyl oligopeptidase family protein [Haliea sp. ETY-M]
MQDDIHVIRKMFWLLGLLMAATGCSERASQAPETPDSNSEAEAMATLPYGSWPSPISAASLVEGVRGIGGLSADGDYLYWLESRPTEGGRNTVMRWREGEDAEELLPAPWNVRTRVQEYGGGALLVADGTLWFSNFADQRLYRFRAGEEPVAITPDAALRFAGCVYDAPRSRLLCIREDHRGLEEPVNTLVAIPDSAEGEFEGEVLFSGSDFVSAPRISGAGDRIAFTAWMHPNMPWDSTTLYSATFDADGNLADLVEHNPDTAESVIDPQWAEDGTLLALSDRDNWWRPYRVDGTAFTAMDTGLENVEIGGPDWTINSRYYYPLADGALLLIARRGSVETLYRLTTDGRAEEIATGAVSYGSLVIDDDGFYLTAGFAERPSALVRSDWSGKLLATVRSSSDAVLSADLVPAFEQVSFPLPDGGTAHGVYLPPTNPGAVALAGTAPPLIVTVHGGPTSVAGVSYSPSDYYWTSRGFAVLDLNYRGSTGFGRAYRRALYGAWGIADVEDAIAGATWLAEQGKADPSRLIIRGGSAGGYTTLAVHAFGDAFAAGASYFGVSDIEALAKETHKFESRYLDQLIGPYPERRDLYLERSPISHLDGFSAPLILLQGLDDPIVPPNQSEMIYEALKKKGVPTAYMAYEGESHGFRKAENQISSLEAELYFYSRVLGLDVADELPAIAIDNLGAAAED